MWRASLRGMVLCSTLAGVVVLVAGCTETPSDENEKNAAVGSPQPPMGGNVEAKGGPGGPGGGRGRSKINAIMTTLTKGQQSLTAKIGAELKTEEPPWDAIQAQTKEYVQLTSELGAEKPPKGSAESWEKLTTAFAASAVELDKAAQAKEKAEAIAAHTAITKSCNACHQAHREMRGGFGGGMPPGGMRPGGGPGGPGGGTGGGPGGGIGGGPPGGGPPPEDGPPGEKSTPK